MHPLDLSGVAVDGDVRVLPPPAVDCEPGPGDHDVAGHDAAHAWATLPPGPGTLALLAFLLHDYAADGVWAEAVSTYGFVLAHPADPAPRDTRLAARIAARLRPIAADLGLDAVAGHRAHPPESTLPRPGRGLAAGVDLLHVTLGASAAAVLTVATVRHHAGRMPDSGDVAPAPTDPPKTPRPAPRRQYGPIPWGPYNRHARPGVRELHRGACGEDVRALQWLLAAEPGLPPVNRRTVDGRMGDETVQALRWWQASQGLPITGVVDADSWAVLCV